MEALLEYIITSLVDFPERIEIRSETAEDGVHITVSVDSRDAGIIIGKRGYVVKAIRQLVRVISYRDKQKVFLDIVPLEPVMA